MTIHKIDLCCGQDSNCEIIEISVDAAEYEVICKAASILRISVEDFFKEVLKSLTV